MRHFITVFVPNDYFPLIVRFGLLADCAHISFGLLLGNAVGLG